LSLGGTTNYTPLGNTSIILVMTIPSILEELIIDTDTNSSTAIITWTS